MDRLDRSHDYITDIPPYLFMDPRKLNTNGAGGIIETLAAVPPSELDAAITAAQEHIATTVESPTSTVPFDPPSVLQQNVDALRLHQNMLGKPSQRERLTSIGMAAVAGMATLYAKEHLPSNPLTATLGSIGIAASIIGGMRHSRRNRGIRAHQRAREQVFPVGWEEQLNDSTT